VSKIQWLKFLVVQEVQAVRFSQRIEVTQDAKSAQ
jgi:hypothetical protein